MLLNKIAKTCLAVVFLLVCLNSVTAENIDPYNDGSQYAYGENVGWINFQPDQGPGVHASSGQVAGFAWAENIGWINLSPASYGGVVNDGAGNLSGHAWGENVGWINFGPAHGGVTIDSQGDFDGWAWGENIGWIHFKSSGPVAYKVQACVVTIDDLANFASGWLQTGGPANLDGSGDVGYNDFAIFTGDWQDYCADGWQLK